jgi:hypothetical protein
MCSGKKYRQNPIYNIFYNNGNISDIYIDNFFKNFI